MTSVNLKASGYTWRCPECRAENYTGAAPSAVCCSKCNGTFDVRSLVHRRQKTYCPSAQKGSNSRGDQQTLFDGFQGPRSHSPDDDIPF